jgi:hypothetical protein
LPVSPERLLAPDWMVRGDSFAQGTRCPAVGNLLISRPVPARVTCAPACEMPGISSRGARAVGVDAAGGGHRADQLPGPAGEDVDLGGEGADLVQEHRGQLGVIRAGPAVQRLGQLGPPGLHRAACQVCQRPGAALGGDQRLDQLAYRLGGHRAGHCRHLDKRVFQQLLQPGPVPGPLVDQAGAQPGVIPPPADRRRGHGTGPQQAPPGALGLPHTAGVSVLGRPGRCFTSCAPTSCTSRPAASSR